MFTNGTRVLVLIFLCILQRTVDIYRCMYMYTYIHIYVYTRGLELSGNEKISGERVSGVIPGSGQAACVLIKEVITIEIFCPEARPSLCRACRQR